MDHNSKKIVSKNNSPLTIGENGQQSGQPKLKIVEAPQIDKNCPWKYIDGTFLSDDELKRTSKEWVASTWEDFLQKTVERQALDEELFTDDPVSIEYSLTQEDHDQFIKEHFSRDRYAKLESLIRLNIESKLSKQQLKVMKLYYWEGLSQREIAKKMGLSRNTIRRAKARSIAKLREIFLKKLVR